MKFKIEQVALCPNPERIEEAVALLSAIGINFPVLDTVVAQGAVHGVAAQNTANLAFNYDAISGNELELLQYTEGKNWMQNQCRVSHLGMHCSADDLTNWKLLFIELGIGVAQEVFTQSHTNAAIKDSRRYNYVIFDTHDIIGVDLKFIIRLGV